MCPLIVTKTITSRSHAKRPQEPEDHDLNLDLPIKRHCGSVDTTSRTPLFTTPSTPQPGNSPTNPPNPVAHMFTMAAQQLRKSAPNADTGVRVQHNLVSTLMLTDLSFSNEPRNPRDDKTPPNVTDCSSNPPADVPEAGDSSKSTDTDFNPPTNIPDADAGTPISGPRLKLRGGRKSPVPKDATLQETALLKLRYGDPRVPLSREDRKAILAHLQEMLPLAETGDHDVWELRRNIARMLSLRIQSDTAIEAAEGRRMREESASRDAGDLLEDGGGERVPHLDLGPAESDGEEVVVWRLVRHARRRYVSLEEGDRRSHVPAEGEGAVSDGGANRSRTLATQQENGEAADPPIDFGFEG
ncbi:MAG: hypothetical protein Q9208_004579 [Pyrenodesmia sp. 3 TL-2023]